MGGMLRSVRPRCANTRISLKKEKTLQRQLDFYHIRPANAGITTLLCVMQLFLSIETLISLMYHVYTDKLWFIAPLFPKPLPSFW
jgi:hypothetical protein